MSRTQIIPSNPQEKPAILVVDDEHGYRDAVTRILRSNGYEADSAENGIMALAKVEERDYPIMLVDLKMPEMDGFELIQKLSESRPETLCIVVSAFATIESAVETTKMGAFDFVVKPFFPDDLMVVVNRACDKWRLSQEALRLRNEREGHLLELAAEKSRIRTIIQSMGDGLLVVNVDGDVVLDNRAARRLLGRVLDPVHEPLKNVIHDEKLLEEVSKVFAEKTEGEVVLELRIASPTQGQEDRYLRATVNPVAGQNGSAVGAVVLLSDITDAKAFDRMKTLFISMVAHELKAPIGAVEGYLNLIASGALDQNVEKIKEVSSRCLDRTGALLALIGDLLEISRRDSGRQERRIEPVDVTELVSSMVEFHRNQAEQRKLRIELNLQPQMGKALVDRYEIERLLTNLLSNAIKYNRENGEIRIRVGLVEGILTIEVRDTGIGMTPEERRRLGEEFFRAKNAKTRAIPGTGLGLALVKKIVDGYHGALEIESIPDQGTTFRALIPVGNTR